MIKRFVVVFSSRISCAAIRRYTVVVVVFVVALGPLLVDLLSRVMKVKYSCFTFTLTLAFATLFSTQNRINNSVLKNINRNLTAVVFHSVAAVQECYTFKT